MSAKSARDFCESAGIAAPNYIIYRFSPVGNVEIVSVAFDKDFARRLADQHGQGHFVAKVKEPLR